MKPAPAIRVTKRSYAFGLFLLTGYLPSGVDMRWRDRAGPPHISLCGAESAQTPPRWILSCGHTMAPAEAARWKAAGLMQDAAPDKFGRPALEAGPQLPYWAAHAFHGLRHARWGHP
jgi:hypothetical protein